MRYLHTGTIDHGTPEIISLLELSRQHRDRVVLRVGKEDIFGRNVLRLANNTGWLPDSVLNAVIDCFVRFGVEAWQKSCYAFNSIVFDFVLQKNKDTKQFDRLIKYDNGSENYETFGQEGPNYERVRLTRHKDFPQDIFARQIIYMPVNVDDV